MGIIDHLIIMIANMRYTILFLACSLLLVGCGKKQTVPTTQAVALRQLWVRTFDDGRTNSFDKDREITGSIIENFPERLPPESPSRNAFVWMDVSFGYVDSAPVDAYFNHTPERDYIRDNGGASQIKDEKEAWVSFVAIDKDRNPFDRFLCHKDDPSLANVILNLKKGDKLRLGGRVGKMTTDVRWFIVDSIDQY